MNPVFRKKLSALGERNFFSIATVELSTRCNLQCKYCYVDSGKRDLSTGEIKDVLDRLADAGVLALAFTGGEIFLRHDILAILEYSFKLQFFETLILTNGSLLNKEHIEFLSKHVNYLGYVRLSFFSHDPAIHDAFTGVAGSFEVALENAVKLKMNKMNVYVIINLIEENVELLNETKTFFESRGFIVQVGYVKFMAKSTADCCGSLTTREFYRRYFDQCTPSRLDSWRQSLEYYGGDAKKEPLCERLFSMITIRANGDIVPCVAFRDVSIGNVLANRRPLQEIFQDSEFIRQLRAVHRSDVEPCRDCKHVDFCMLCPAMMLAEHGSYRHPPQQSCNFVEALDATLHI